MQEPMTSCVPWKARIFSSPIRLRSLYQTSPPGPVMYRLSSPKQLQQALTYADCDACLMPSGLT